MVRVHVVFKGNDPPQINHQGGHGIGSLTGTVYRVITNVVNVMSEVDTNGAMVTNVQFRDLVIAPGEGNNYITTSRMHITVNANGEVTAAWFENMAPPGEADFYCR